MKIGVIAPTWTLPKIKQAISKHEDKGIEFSFFLFEELINIEDILEKNYLVMDRWILSGPLPYAIARWYLGTAEKLFFIDITEAGVARSIIEAMSENKCEFDRLSLDFIGEAGDIDIILKELGLPYSDIKKTIYNIPFDENTIVDFHYNLWKKDEIDCAITTVPSVYNKLSEKGIPVYSIRATMMEVKSSTDFFVEQVKSSYYKRTQISMVILEICNYHKLAETMPTPYKQSLLELEIREFIIKYCQQIGAYMVPMGNGRFEIFASIGRVEEDIKYLRDLVDTISLITNLPVLVGIGVGETVFISQSNANKALKYSRENNSITLIRENGEIIESMGKEGELIYDLYTDDKHLDELLTEANVGILTYKKMKAVLRRTGWEMFTAEQMAEQLNVTTRNIRRILSGMDAAGIVECAGTESSGGKGRPARIYKFVV